MNHKHSYRCLEISQALKEEFLLRSQIHEESSISIVETLIADSMSTATAASASISLFSPDCSSYYHKEETPAGGIEEVQFIDIVSRFAGFFLSKFLEFLEKIVIFFVLMAGVSSTRTTI